MKKRNLNALKLNKKAIAKFHLTGGKAPASNGCADPDAPHDEPHEWFTDAAERACETFDGTGCF